MTVRYRSLISDNTRWDGFEFRAGDIVISTPPKCGTTWTQMLCALLIFDGPVFPLPLGQISPWLDQTIRDLDEVRAIYRAQTHRRFIKTHTPLDGLPRRDDVTYVVVGRDPRDLMVSMEHHWNNMDLERVLALREQAVGNDDLDTLPQRPAISDDPTQRFRAFVKDSEYTGAVNLTVVMHHLDTGWQHRRDDNVIMCHYADYTADLPRELVRLGRALGFDLPIEKARDLALDASLDRMRARAGEVAPNVAAHRRRRSAREARGRAHIDAGLQGPQRSDRRPDPHRHLPATPGPFDRRRPARCARAQPTHRRRARPAPTNLERSRRPHPAVLAGARMCRMLGMGPILHGMGLLHIIGTYNGEATVSLTASRDIMPDLPFYGDCIDESFEALNAASSRRRPSHGRQARAQTSPSP